MSIPAQFDAKTIENKWYAYWMKNNYFHSEPDHRTPYTIVIPPPNVTGVLHMGHMLNNTIQDVLIRRARLKGFNACWVPGTDHASIATEAKVVAKLKSEGINKADLTREEFLKHAYDWTDKYGGTILEQLKQLGCSCDWDRTKFTMDEDMSASVTNDEKLINQFKDFGTYSPDRREVRELGANGTPTFVLNGKKIENPDNTAEAFSKILDQALAGAGN
jgi:valyl-tRNA synthetase